MDYTVFDRFLDVETWHTNHPLDDWRFLLALRNAIQDERFSPNDMGDYIRNKTGNHKEYEARIDSLVEKAETILDYEQATSRY